MMTLQLHDVHIYANHGIYEGEDKSGNPYIVNLDVTYDERHESFDDISSTINYVDLFEIVRNRMQIATGLLEKICDSIILHIKHQYPFVLEIKLSIYKLQAPIKNFQGRVGVSMNKKFND